MKKAISMIAIAASLLGCGDAEESLVGSYVANFAHKLGDCDGDFQETITITQDDNEIIIDFDLPEIDSIDMHTIPEDNGHFIAYGSLYVDDLEGDITFQADIKNGKIEGTVAYNNVVGGNISEDACVLYVTSIIE